MMEAGRNDPCPCGSGKKYKQCHGGANQTRTSPEERVWRALRRVLEGCPTMMFRFVQDVYGPAAIEEAWDEFTLWESDDPEFDPDTPHLHVFMPWFYHKWAPDPADSSIEDVSLHHRSPSSVLIEKRGRRLDPLLRRYVEGCVRAPFSFHEIVRTDPGVGFRARDVLTGEEHEVLERSASRTMQTGDVFFGQLVTCDGATLLEACSPHPIPPREKLRLIDLRERIEGDPLGPSPEPLEDWDTELREAYLKIMDGLINPRLPRLQNTDGEEIAFHRLVFEIGSARRAFDALKHLSLDEPETELLESADHDAEGELRRVSFAWKAPGNPMHKSWENTVHGHIEIDGDQLVASVNSRERAVRLKGIVEKSLGEDARHRITEIESVEDALGRARARPKEPDERRAPSLADHPEIRDRIRELTSAHYEGWVSEEIPALGGLTPLQAVKDKAGREKVEALITQMERDGRRMEPPLDETVLRRLRQRLGLV